MKLKLISCEVFFREFCHVVARSPHQIDIEFVPKGLHDMGRVPMRDRLQEVLDRVNGSGYDAILLGYGLCNFGVAGLRTPSLPLVIPRAHDCMTLFFGSQKRYFENFHSNPGTYYLTTGWMERGEPTGETKQLSIQHQTGMDRTFEELAELYGEDNARYLMEQLGNQTRHYSRIAFIEMGIEPNDSFQAGAEQRARERGLAFERLQGDMRLFLDLVNGHWNDRDFLTVPPGHRIGVSEDGQRIYAEPDQQ